MESGVKKSDAIAVMCPHAGLVYSGAVAGAVYSRINPPHTFILLGPNHTGYGADVALMHEGSWQIPGGELLIDEALAREILDKVPDVQADYQAHLREHSLEVQLPFIMRIAPKAMIVPITIKHSSLSNLKEIGRGIANAVRGAGYPVVIVASSDMSHFLSDQAARHLDRIAIDRLLALDPDGLYSEVREKHISMCGILPATAMLSAANELGASTAELVRYATSAEVSGDFDRVVGYAGVTIR